MLEIGFLVEHVRSVYKPEFDHHKRGKKSKKILKEYLHAGENNGKSTYIKENKDHWHCQYIVNINIIYY